MYDFTTLGALVGLAIAIVLIIRKVRIPPTAWSWARWRAASSAASTCPSATG